MLQNRGDRRVEPTGVSRANRRPNARATSLQREVCKHGLTIALSGSARRGHREALEDHLLIFRPIARQYRSGHFQELARLIQGSGHVSHGYQVET